MAGSVPGKSSVSLDVLEERLNGHIKTFENEKNQLWLAVNANREETARLRESMDQRFDELEGILRDEMQAVRAGFQGDSEAITRLKLTFKGILREMKFIYAGIGVLVKFIYDYFFGGK